MTASYQLKPPGPLTITKPKEWPKWLRRFERFRVLSGLSEKSEETQVSLLIYTMGDTTDEIMHSFRLSEDDSKRYAIVKGKFDSYFVKKRNFIYERARFNRHKQEDGKSVDSFITDLHTLAEHCDFGALHNQLIRDRIVVEIMDSKVS